MKPINRREFVRLGSMSLGAAMFPPPLLHMLPSQFESKRPLPEKRNFSSNIVEQTILDTSKMIADEELAWLFSNCYPNTLDTTVKYTEKQGVPDTFVITGDIEAMWLRDSSAQVWPYLPLSNKDASLRKLIEGVIRRQTACILLDPYANAFNDGPGNSPWMKDLTAMKPELHERKWEIDSLCYPVRLAYGYWKTTGDTSPFDASWLQSVKLIYKTFTEQQRIHDKGPYKFQRYTAVQSDTVAGGGYGNPVKPVGLICSTFRPSDDATLLPFLIPSNLFAVATLEKIAQMVTAISHDAAFATQCRKLASTVSAAIRKHGVVTHPVFGKIYCFETDGFGNHYLMDDANVPSLLSLPYLGLIASQDPVYRNTRAFVLSEYNPYFYRGKTASGIGGPHVGEDYIWPMSIIIRAMTADKDTEIAACIRMLKATHAGTGFMHESFHKDDPANFTRKWFAWANTLFGELILKVSQQKPHLLKSRF